MSSPPPPGSPRASARLPALLVLLSIPSLCVGLLGLFLSFSELSGAMQDRGTAVERMRDAQLALYDSKRLLPALQQLPRAEVERLALLYGDARHERRNVAVPLALLSLLCSWLLTTGALGTLRRQPGALPLWRFACLCNIPLAILSAMVTLVQAQELMGRLGPELGAALGKLSGRPAAVEVGELWGWTRLYVLGWGLGYGLWALCLGASAMGLSRYTVVERSDEPEA